MSFLKRTLIVTAVGGVAAGVVAVGMMGSASGDVISSRTDPVIRAAALAQEQRTATCMSQRGFSYVAALPNDVLIDEAYQAAVDAGKSGAELQAAMAAAEAALPADPNVAVVQQMPASRVEAWSEALAGTDAAVGCSESSVTMTAQELAELEAQTAAGEAAQVAAESDPVVRAAEAGYVACMSVKGYSVTDTVQIDAVLDAAVAVQRPAETAWPEPPAADASAAEQAVYRAKVAALTLREQQADAILEKGTAAHEGCVGPYDDAVAAVYERLTP